MVCYLQGIPRISCTCVMRSSCGAKQSTNSIRRKKRARNCVGHKIELMNELTKEHFATNVYYDRTFDRDAAKILPGEYYYTGKDMLIVTVLGSCVSACIRDRVTGVGGMNHFMLPDSGGDVDSP